MTGDQANRARYDAASWAEAERRAEPSRDTARCPVCRQFVPIVTHRCIFDDRVVVALDVDGVLNPDYLRPGLVEHRIVVPAEEIPVSRFTEHSRDLHLTLYLDPSHGPWITGLRRRADVVWVSTWEHAANTHLARLLGIEPLDVAVSVRSHPPSRLHVEQDDAAAWKAAALSDLYAGRALVWVDDQAGRWAEHWDRDGAPTLVIAPDPRVGLTDAQRAEIDAFVAEHTGHGGEDR